MSQQSLPIADISVSGWLPTPVYGYIDSPSGNDNSYVSVTTPQGGTFEIKLAGLAWPREGQQMLRLRIRQMGTGPTYAYAGYGIAAFLTPAFGSRSSSDYHWETFFATYRWDNEIGMYQVRNRWLAPHLGIWRQPDPLGLASGLNLYAYVKNAPTNLTDPSGEDCPGCDVPAWALGNVLNDSRCALACCAQHDQCYFCSAPIETGRILRAG